MANAQIINNELSEAESGLRVDNPYITVHYFDKPKPVAGGEMFFGIPSQDPEIAANQKRVYLIQEDGTVLPIDQPVKLSAGGVASYNGSPAKLAVDGEFSWKVLDKNGAQVYYSPRTSHPNLQDVGSTSIIEEYVTLNGGETSVSFETVDVSMATLDINGPLVDSKGLFKDLDYTIADGASGTIFLLSSYPDGTTVRARQNAFSSQVDGGSSAYPYVYDTITQAVTEDLVIGDKVLCCGNGAYDDGLAYTMYRVVSGGTGTNDGVLFINMDNGNQLQSLQTSIRTKKINERVGIPNLNSGTLTLDAQSGTVQSKTLTESVTNIAFANVNQGESFTFTVRFTQDGTGGRGINFAGLYGADGNAPTISSGAGDQDIIVFTYFGGTVWYAFNAGNNMSPIS